MDEINKLIKKCQKNIKTIQNIKNKLSNIEIIAQYQILEDKQRLKLFKYIQYKKLLLEYKKEINYDIKNILINFTYGRCPNCNIYYIYDNSNCNLLCCLNCCCVFDYKNSLINLNCLKCNKSNNKNYDEFNKLKKENKIKILYCNECIEEFI